MLERHLVRIVTLAVLHTGRTSKLFGELFWSALRCRIHPLVGGIFCFPEEVNMDEIRSIFVVLVLLLSVAITVPDILADARQVEWKVPFESEAIPLNLSGKSAAMHFAVSKEPAPNVASPKSVERHVDVSIRDTETNVIEGGPIVELLPGFDVMNNLVTRPQGVHVQCWNNDRNSALPPYDHIILVDTVVPSGSVDGWDLQVIDPENQHIKYRCSWQLEVTEPVQEIKHEAWVDLSSNYGGRMPFYCARCTWKLLDDGLYLYNLKWKLFVKVSDWNVNGPE